MASFVKAPVSSLLRSSTSAQAARCWCSRPASTAGRRFLATAVELPQTQVTTPSASEQDAATSSTFSQTPTADITDFSLMPPSFPSRRAPSPVPPERAAEAQQIYLPNIIIRLIRNSPREAKNPFIATFRVPVQLTKPDIVSYLWQVYGLKVTSISTITEMGEIVRQQPGSYKAKYRKKNTKKAIVGLEEPFWFPEPRPKDYLDEYFGVQMQKDYEQQLLMPAGDVASGASRKSWRWRGASATKQGVGARYSQIVKRLAERRASQEQQVMSLVEKEKADLTDRLAKLKAQ